VKANTVLLAAALGAVGYAIADWLARVAVYAETAESGGLPAPSPRTPITLHAPSTTTRLPETLTRFSGQ
jgi:hypothetical protein